MNKAKKLKREMLRKQSELTKLLFGNASFYCFCSALNNERSLSSPRLSCSNCQLQDKISQISFCTNEEDLANVLLGEDSRLRRLAEFKVEYLLKIRDLSS
jgi:hypothetical protein